MEPPEAAIVIGYVIKRQSEESAGSEQADAVADESTLREYSGI